MAKQSTPISAALRAVASEAVSAAIGQGLAMDLCREAATAAVLDSISDPSRSASERFEDFGRACAADVNERFGFDIPAPTLSNVCEFTKGRDGKPARGQCTLQNGQRIGNPVHKLQAYIVALRPYVKAHDVEGIAKMTTGKATGKAQGKPEAPKAKPEAPKPEAAPVLTPDACIAALQTMHAAGTLAPEHYAALQGITAPALPVPMVARVAAPALTH